MPGQCNENIIVSGENSLTGRASGHVPGQNELCTLLRTQDEGDPFLPVDGSAQPEMTVPTH